MEHNLHTYIRGMLLLGAYGDALGAPHEHDGLEGRVIDPERLGQLVEASIFYPAETSGDPWWIWADAQAVQSMRGALTDDTSFRMMLLHPWMEKTGGDYTLLTEGALRMWLHQEKDVTASVACPAGLWRSRQKQIAAWLEMYEASEQNRARLFYAPDVPVVFGLFMYLDLAVSFAARDPFETYTVFKDFCLLDQGSAGVYTGILAGALSAGVSTMTAPEQFSDRFMEAARLLIRRALSEASGQEHKDLDIARQALEGMTLFGEKHRSHTGYEFLKAFRTQIYTDENQPFNHSPAHLKNYHPHLFWMQIISTLAYTGDRPLEALRILSAGVGDTDTVASILGTIMGAWIGYDRIAAESIGETPLAEELDEIAGNIRSLYGIDFEDRVNMFVQKTAT